MTGELAIVRLLLAAAIVMLAINKSRMDAVALIMLVALAVAKELNVSPYPLAMINAFAATTAFMTLASSQVNTLVVALGDDTFSDFVRIGVLLAFLVSWLLPRSTTAISVSP